MNVGILERPLVQGLVWGLVTGDVSLALSVSAVFELFWLDLIPAGTFIPPNAAASNLAALMLIHFFGFTTPAEAMFPILFSLPLSWFAARLEQFQRYRQNAAYDALQAQVRLGRDTAYAPARLVERSILQSGILYFVFFVASLMGLIVLTGMLLSNGFLHMQTDALGWGHLWVAASFGPLLSLRSMRAYALLVAGACCVTVAAFFGRF
ncbi:PTS sugar transporter subunit IIC [Desulfobaculum xiamenense]|uniref:PTS sugar transporter subunit IIC n=1 Tax=Desulfobaculum xiamenense TaxID=995050 RepID=UPI003158C577